MGSNSTSCYYNQEIIRRNSILPTVDSPIPLTTVSTSLSNQSTNSSVNLISNNNNSETNIIPDTSSNLNTTTNMLQNTISVADSPPITSSPISSASSSTTISSSSTTSSIPFQNQQYTIDLYSSKSYDHATSQIFSSSISPNNNIHKNTHNDSWINNYYLPKYGKLLTENQDNFSPIKKSINSPSDLYEQSSFSTSLTTSSSLNSTDSILNDHEKASKILLQNDEQKKKLIYNTKVLIGWQINVDGLGTGYIHSFIDQHEDTLRFLIQLRDGRKFVLPILIPHPNSKNNEINLLPETNLISKVFNKD